MKKKTAKEKQCLIQIHWLLPALGQKQRKPVAEGLCFIFYTADTNATEFFMEFFLLRLHKQMTASSICRAKALPGGPLCVLCTEHRCRMKCVCLVIKVAQLFFLLGPKLHSQNVNWFEEKIANFWSLPRPHLHEVISFQARGNLGDGSNYYTLFNWEWANELSDQRSPSFMQQSGLKPTAT